MDFVAASRIVYGAACIAYGIWTMATAFREIEWAQALSIAEYKVRRSAQEAARSAQEALPASEGTQDG